MSERETENLVLTEMNMSLGENDFGFVFDQGDTLSITKITNLLKKAGGKPKVCSLADFDKGGPGKAQPEYIIALNKDLNLLIVIECKKSTKYHASENLDMPKGYAVDGALYYAKFLKEDFNVIALGVSGTKKENMKVSTLYWPKGMDKYVEFPRGKDVLYSPENYINLIQGKKVEKAISIEDIQKLALIMHNNLRALKMTERAKPVFIAGILIALKNETFINDYRNLTSFDALLNMLQQAINDELVNSDIRPEKISDIKTHFKMIGKNSKLKEIPLSHDNSLLWYVEQLETKIKPMMDYSSEAVDALGIFYHEFVKYSGGDGSGLGIVLTPQHLTEFMADLAEVNKSSKVVDICCGSGAFLVTAMSKMFKGATQQEINKIRKESLFGVESDDDIYTLAIANMIVRGDGKSNIFYGDCFNKNIIKNLKEKKINIGLINPPYSQKDHCELEFVENMLDILVTGGTGVVVVPMSCAIGTKFKDVRERLFKNHTLKAVFSMPDDIFYANNASTNVCVMVWEAHKPHNSAQNTFFGYYKDDGFVKAKKLGRIDKFNKWENIKKEWLSLYRERDVKDGFTAKKPVKWNDEWLCEAYMETDYSTLKETDFEKTIKNYLSYLVLTDQYNLYKKISEKSIKEPNPCKLTDINTWQKFKLEHLFEVKGTKTTKLDDLNLTGIGKHPYVTTQSVNNGVAGYYNLFTEKGNVLTADSAVVGFCSYQENDFSASDHVEKLLPKFEMNKYIAMFLTTIINLENYRYSYGRKFNQTKIKDTLIKLPVNSQGNPDWQFMENYIKSLPYSDLI